MDYRWFYKTPAEFDDIILLSEGEYLTGLLFINSDSKNMYNNFEEKRLKVFDDTIKWLDIYFSGEVPEFIPKYKINNSTSFRKEVTDIMNTISYGCTVTYNDIAKNIAGSREIKKMSPQAVGGAVGSNPICIIIPCHRVVGTNGNLTGYGGGLKNKIALLKLEGNDMSMFYLPK